MEGHQVRNSSVFYYQRSFLLVCLPPHAVLDVVVDDEVQFLLGKAVMSGKDAVDFVKNELSCI